MDNERETREKEVKRILRRLESFPQFERELDDYNRKILESGSFSSDGVFVILKRIDHNLDAVARVEALVCALLNDACDVAEPLYHPE